jgi:hypothetical protein
MPVYQELVNFNELVTQLRSPPIIINDLGNVFEDSRDYIRNLIMSRYTTDMISILPSCHCGRTKGEFAIEVECEYCHKPVRSIVNEDIEPLVWFRAPEGVRALINPTIWFMLDQRFVKSGFNIIQWICDSTYRPNIKQPLIINELSELGIERGYNYFIDHFADIMAVLFNHKEFKKKRQVKTDYLYHLLQDYPERIFSQYIPLPNKSLLILEQNCTGRWIDPIHVGAIDAIMMIAGIDSPFSDYSVKTKERRTVKALSKLSDFYFNFYKTSLSKKSGIFRKHVFGTRSHFSFRAVISSLTNDHAYDEIHVPWSVGITAFQPHLLNKLMKMGIAQNDAIGMLYGHVYKYHPLLDQLLNQLLDESPDRRIVCIIQRNPSLLAGSAQRVFITKFKTDVHDNTISISILITKAPNADFDGDEMNVSLAIDHYMAERWYGLAPHKNVFELTRPREVSGSIALPKPVVATISNFVASRRGYEFSQDQIDRFNALPEA